LKEKTKSVALYLDFCLTSIRCIQATVEFLHEREQTRPHDRPYTNGYFVDLVDQIRQYAQQLQATKEKEAKGEKLDDLDAEASDEVKLYGGLTRNGRPAELVRVKKNGKAISIATGEPVENVDDDDSGGLKMKRSLSDEEDDDESVMRSMARRKRSASAAELAPKQCREPGCDKEFKRPCDLTKHEKTHSRPWKCPHGDCKFHDQGWPTEKELDRHINDKHSSAPKFFECHFSPCPYKSKRESNCKQHMEKSHGWTYVRSKNNGKNRSKSASGPKQTPQIANMHTPSTDSPGIATPEDDGDYDMTSGYDVSTAYDQSIYSPDEIDLPEYKTEDLNAYDATMAMPPFHVEYSPVESDLSHTPNLSSTHTSPYLLQGNTGFQMNGGHNFNMFQNSAADFDLFPNEDLYSAHVQLPTPSHEIFERAHSSFATPSIPISADPMPHISPIGHGNAMLYTPSSLGPVEEFEDYNPNDNLGTNDFTLYPSTTSGMGSSASNTNTLFGEATGAISGFGQPSTQEFMQTFYAANTGMEWATEEAYSGYGEQRQ